MACPSSISRESITRESAYRQKGHRMSRTSLSARVVLVAGDAATGHGSGDVLRPRPVQCCVPCRSDRSESVAGLSDGSLW